MHWKVTILESVTHYALITGSTMVIVLTGSANSVIHSVMVDVLERCVSLLSLLICLSFYFFCLYFHRVLPTVPCVQTPVCM